MAVVTTPLGFQKPDGNELVRNGDNAIAINAQKAQDHIGKARADIVNLQSAAGFDGDPLVMQDSVVASLVGTGAETSAAVEAAAVSAAADAAAPKQDKATLDGDMAAAIQLQSTQTSVALTSAIEESTDERVPAIVVSVIAADGTVANAAAAATAAALASSDVVTGPDLRAPTRGDTFDGDLVGFADQDGRSTWISARRSDGGPTDHALKMLADRLGINFDPDGGVLMAITDSAGRHTDIEVSAADGSITDRVMDRWAPRIAERIGGGSGSGLTASDRMVGTGGALVPVFPDVHEFYMFGSSSTQGIAPAMETAMADTVATFHGEGKSGERSEEIFARLGSRPALLTVTGGSIPASGTVTVTASNMPTTIYLKPFTGTLEGVPGQLSSDGTVLTFTRTTAGAVTAVTAGTAFIPDVAKLAIGSVAALWAGKNNTTTTGAHTQVIAQTDASFDWFSPMIKRVLVLGHFIDSTQTAGSIQYVNVEAINAAHKARYGDLYVDVRAYLASPQLWTDTGITPTTNDLAQQAIGVKPDSVSGDAAHLNAAGYTAVANFIRAHFALLGWY